jgi:excisionase family DNA binding protein
MTQPNDLLDIHQAAAFLQVSLTSLRRWTDRGLLPCLRVGGRRERRFRRADLEAFMEREPAAGRGGVDDGALAIPQVAGIAVPYGSHFAGLYRSDAGRTKLAAAFLADGLAQGSVCFLIADPTASKPIVELLEGSVPSPRKLRLTVSPYRDRGSPQIEFWEAAYIKAVQAGATSLRSVGDVSGVPPKFLQEDWPQYEADYDRLLAKRFPVITLCLYDVRRHSGEQTYDVLREHKDMFRYPAERFLG